MKYLNTFTFCTALTFAGVAFAQSTQDWDSDGDGSLNRDEWSAGMDSSSAFGDWDTNASGMIEAEEFGEGMFARYDADGDGFLTSGEWDDGIDATYGEDGADLDLANWDSDGDGQLSREEFGSQFETNDLFDEYRSSANFDTSAEGLSQDEFNTGMFDQMDRNDDDILSEDENTWMD